MTETNNQPESQSEQPNPLQEELDRYKSLQQKLGTLSRIKSRQFHGDRDDAPSRFISELEMWTQLHGSDMVAFLKLFSRLGLPYEEIISTLADVLEEHIDSLAKDLAVKDWGDDGKTPILDLEKFREMTADWPA